MIERTRTFSVQPGTPGARQQKPRTISSTGTPAWEAADSARAILDDHLVLTRSLADAGHYPAIDIEQSISRAMVSLITPEHFAQIRRFKQYFSRYQRSRDLISVGAYAPGSDPMLDQAIKLYPAFENFLQQPLSVRADYSSSIEHLSGLFAAS